MAKKDNDTSIEQLRKNKEYISPQIENYLAFRLAKKSFMIIITTIGVLTALLGYFGISYTQDLKQNLEETKSTFITFKKEIINERKALNEEISNFHEKMAEEIKEYDTLSDRYEKSLSNFEIRRTNLDQHMGVLMETFMDNIARSTEKLYEEISGVKELNEKSKELIGEHKKLLGDLARFKEEIATGQKDFIDEYIPRINEILESQIIWIRQDLAVSEDGFKIKDKNFVIKFTDITLKENKQEVKGFRVYSLDSTLIKIQQNLEVGERIEFIHPKTKENYILELKLIIDNLLNFDYAGFVIRTKK